jgi:hypothetical protein
MAPIVGAVIVVGGAWLVVGAIVWYNTDTPPPPPDESTTKCSDCDAAQRKWNHMDWWAKAAAFLEYSGIMLNCSLKGCRITY